MRRVETGGDGRTINREHSVTLTVALKRTMISMPL